MRKIIIICLFLGYLKGMTQPVFNMPTNIDNLKSNHNNGPVNLDFSQGLYGWEYASGKYRSGNLTTNVLTHINSFVDSLDTILTYNNSKLFVFDNQIPQQDVLIPEITNPPSYFKNFCRIGSPTAGGNMHAIYQSFTVPDDLTNLAFYNAVVLESAGATHNIFQEPRYEISLFYDSNDDGFDKSDYVPCTFFSINTDAAASGVTGFEPYAGGQYRKWQSNSYDLRPYQGKKVLLMVVSLDCYLTQHYGYSYFTGTTSSADIEISGLNCIDKPQIYTNPQLGNFSDETINWVIRNDSGIEVQTSTDTEFEFTTAISGDYEIELRYSIQNGFCGDLITDTLKRNITINTEEDCPRIVYDEDCQLDQNEVTYRIENLENLHVSNPNYLWDLDKGLTSQEASPSAIYTVPTSVGVSVVLSRGASSAELTSMLTLDKCRQCDPQCIPSFSPKRGEKYVLNAWVKESNVTSETYENAGVKIFFKGPDTDTTYYASGQIIDGWQRIEAEIKVPNNATAITLTLVNNGTGDVYFDDIRLHPFNSNMKSFVYDPITLRLMAEMDERNYATFYEYDEEGALTRVKKETVKGVKTIQESRNNSSRQ